MARALLHGTPALLLACRELALAVAEFRVSQIAQQDVKTLFPVSEKKLDERFSPLEKLIS